MTNAEIYIGGEWMAPSSGGTIDVLSPSDGQVFANIADGNADDIDRAVRAARASLSGEWGAVVPAERGRILSRLSTLILAHADELADIEARDTGKPMTQARADIAACARYFEFYGGAADKLHGETIPYLKEYFVSVVREPHGVTGHIIPWNYPAQMFGRTLAPALATGNAAVLKPAEEACLSCIRLTELAAEAGLPAGALNLVTGYGVTAGAALSAHGDVDFMSFTGSPEVGTMVQIASAKHHRPCVLELGGKSPQIIFDDADFDAALPVVVAGIVQNGGQTCSAGSRVLIQRSIFDDFTAQLAARIADLVAGPHGKDLNCGPLISGKQRDRVRKFVASAEANGVPCMARAKLDGDAPETGYYVVPALYGPVSETDDLAQKEVFGPLLAAIPFDDEADAVRIANDTDFGLIAGVWTNNGGRQMRMANTLRCGQVFINNYGAGGGVELPFGGVKHSGHGREKGFSAMQEFTVTKTIVLKHT
ncbi:aldehyde dehydrogenase family protein [Antarcticimicrobium sediminis]|uniref:Aldehyde dehydrogenase family protein n=1 Tax=Antarcticimicrobium sediminis TaxID=2546227 RepID=A0A4R5F1W9_9RHOB|nr:aldehyde dehydrogenase family protein [Antarcticimicrobium sediminis]TDE41147.1 aldehyde dehydrogenase family protein [Antarcticimicrobium sediminis]